MESPWPNPYTEIREVEYQRKKEERDKALEERGMSACIVKPDGNSDMYKFLDLEELFTHIRNVYRTDRISINLYKRQFANFNYYVELLDVP